MEYLKESEKFSFGFGTDKLAGNGSAADAIPEIKPKRDIQELGLPGLILHLAGAVLFVTATVFFGMKKKNKKKSKRKK